MIPAGGKSTASTTCTTPLLASTSGWTTFASLILTPSPMCTVTSLPSTVVIVWPSERSLEYAATPTTWYVSTSTNWSLFSGFRSESKVPAGNAANAEFTGAKTVNGPGELSVSTKSPATTAATSVLKSSTD